MTTPTPSSQPTKTPMHASYANTHTVASVLETVGFIAAFVLKILGHGEDSLLSAFGAAVMHSYNH